MGSFKDVELKSEPENRRDKKSVPGDDKLCDKNMMLSPMMIPLHVLTQTSSLENKCLKFPYTIVLPIFTNFFLQM